MNYILVMSLMVSSIMSMEYVGSRDLKKQKRYNITESFENNKHIRDSLMFLEDEPFFKHIFSMYQFGVPICGTKPPVRCEIHGEDESYDTGVRHKHILINLEHLFTCRTCDIGILNHFKNAEDFEAHFFNEHNNNVADNWQCIACKYIGSESQWVWRHVDAHYTNTSGKKGYKTFECIRDRFLKLLSIKTSSSNFDDDDQMAAIMLDVLRSGPEVSKALLQLKH